MRPECHGCGSARKRTDRRPYQNSHIFLVNFDHIIAIPKIIIKINNISLSALKYGKCLSVSMITVRIYISRNV